jgi:glucokinase
LGRNGDAVADELTAATPVAVAVDWGGTWIRASVISRTGEVLWQSRLPNPKGGSREVLLESADGLLEEAIAWCGDRQIVGLGVAAAGPVDIETGTLHDPPNLPALDGVSLKRHWEVKTGYQVWVGNDATLAALGEFHFGVGLDYALQGTPPKTLVYLTVSTGIGGGVVDRDRLLLGASGLAGEIGHMIIDPRKRAPKCQCKNRGCLEALASGTAIARMARAGVAAAGSPDSVLAAEAVQSITSEAVFRAAGQGDKLALSIVDRVVEALSLGLANTLHLFNPDLLVLGGGVTVGLTEAQCLPRIRELILQYAMSERHKDFRLESSRLGDTVGMVGAAAMVWEAVDAPK